VLQFYLESRNHGVSVNWRGAWGRPLCCELMRGRLWEVWTPYPTKTQVEMEAVLDLA
jgi:hypothetical protein